MPKNPNWTRERTCCDCGKVESVRKDNPSERCKSCAARLSGAKGIAVIRAMVKWYPCDCCGKKISKGRFCSVACKRESLSVARECKTCGNGFRIFKSIADGKTNASGNFCSRHCYERFLCKTERVTGRGSQWRKIRGDVLSTSSFCGVCGTVDSSRLQVHHITPFRLTHDNSKENLIPLCRKCHKTIECVTQELENSDMPADQIGAFMSAVLRHRQNATRLVLAGIIKNARSKTADHVRSR